jgi:hypothetical protein
MIRMGATSVVVKTVSFDYWEKESYELLQSVISFSQKEKCVLVQTGAELRASTHMPTKKKGIYVLRIDNRPKPFFYVGKANDIERRIQQHSDGTGAYCITGEPFTRIDPITKGIFT